MESVVHASFAKFTTIRWFSAKVVVSFSVIGNE